jgi:hypothetical protein
VSARDDRPQSVTSIETPEGCQDVAQADRREMGVVAGERGIALSPQDCRAWLPTFEKGPYASNEVFAAARAPQESAWQLLTMAAEPLGDRNSRRVVLRTRG